MTKLLSACCVVSALWFGSAAPPVRAAHPRVDGFVAAAPLLAQYDNDQNRSTRISGRGAAGLVKLVVLLGMGAVGVGGWLIRKMGGGE